jgi:hypothetical protein
MTTFWIVMTVGALVVGSFMAWRVALLFRGRAAYVPRFLAVMTFCLGLWVFSASDMSESRLGFIMSVVALYLPMLLAAAWSFGKERQ